MVSPSSRRASAEHSMCQPGPARAPPRFPRRLVGQRGLPEDEVEGVALVGIVGIAAVLGGHGQHGRLVEMAHLAEREKVVTSK